MIDDTDTIFDSKSFVRSLTHRPGVYCMLNAKYKIIYVGKARDLKKRVSSYFQRSHSDVKTASMMPLVSNVEVTVTNTEAEALILEASLIKKYKPKYNISLRDDKMYPLIEITKEDFSKIAIVRPNKKKDNAKYSGPYVNATLIREALTIIRKIFIR